MPLPHKSMKEGALTLKVQTDCVASVLFPPSSAPPCNQLKVPDGLAIVTAPPSTFFIVIISPCVPNDAGIVSVIGVGLTHIIISFKCTSDNVVLTAIVIVL